MTTNPTTQVTTGEVLLRLVEPFGPKVNGATLGFTTAPPKHLTAALRLLHTAVRARVAGRTWFGLRGGTGHVVELNLAERIPAGVTLLAVEGDTTWDRIRPDAAIDHPGAFDPPAPVVAKPAKKSKPRDYH